MPLSPVPYAGRPAMPLVGVQLGVGDRPKDASSPNQHNMMLAAAFAAAVDVNVLLLCDPN